MMPLVAAQLDRARRVRAVVRLRPFDVSSDEGRSRERYRRIALNTITGMSARAVAAAVSLVSVPLALGYVGREQYGLWAAITAITTWAALFDFGVVNGLVNSVSEAHGRDDPEAARAYVSSALVLLAGIAALFALAFAVSLPLVPWERVFAVRPGLVSSGVLRASVAAAVVPFILGLPLSVVRQVYAGYQKAYVGNGFLLAASALSLVGLVVAVRQDLGLPGVVFAAGAGTLLASALNFVFLTRVEMPWLRLSISAASRPAVRRLMSTSVPLFLFQAGALLVNESQILVLAHRSGLPVVADYSVVMRIYLLLASFISLGTGSFVPSFREAFERGDREWLRRSFRRMLKVRLAMAVGAAAVLVLAGNLLLGVWLRRTPVQLDAPVWLALGALMVAATWGSAYSELLTILDRIWVQVGLVVINGACTVGGTYALAPRFGLLGAVVASAMVPALVLSWALPFLARPVLASRGPDA
jgi:O-antigen/teichoic acid export membrane protein